MNEGVGRFFWDTSEAVWDMKQMCVLHIQQLNSWPESGLLPLSPFGYFRQKRSMERFRVGWPKTERCFWFFRADIIHPWNRTTRPCRWAELGRCQQRKGSGLEGLQNHTWSRIPAVISSVRRRSTTQHLHPVFAFVQILTWVHFLPVRSLPFGKMDHNS